MEHKIDLKQLIFHEMSYRDGVRDAITYAKEHYYNKIKHPVKSIKPVLKSDHTTEDVEQYLQELKEYQKNNDEYSKLMQNYYTSRTEIEDIIIEYIKQEAHFEIVPEIYKQRILNKALLDYDSFYDLFSKLDNLTDIFNV
jgi:hypothetical protein